MINEMCSLVYILMEWTCLLVDSSRFFVYCHLHNMIELLALDLKTKPLF